MPVLHPGFRSYQGFSIHSLIPATRRDNIPQENNSLAIEEAKVGVRVVVASSILSVGRKGYTTYR